jgi:ABC-type branched-chain amino acid transport systems, ATPase component
MAQLEVRGVNKSFGGLRALNEINLTVEPGAVHAIIGTNGAGKSTLLNCLNGRLEPDTGTVTFEGASIVGKAPATV